MWVSEKDKTGGMSIYDMNDEELKKYKKDNLIKVEADSIIGDDVLKFEKEILAIKIDVESHEIFVLKGLIKNLNQNKCLILIEIGHNKFNQVNDFLIKNHFSIVFKSKLRSDYVYSNFNHKMN